MDKLLKCFFCGKRASYSVSSFKYISNFDPSHNSPDVLFHICEGCNEDVSEDVETYPLIQILKGGQNG